MNLTSHHHDGDDGGGGGDDDDNGDDGDGGDEGNYPTGEFEAKERRFPLLRRISPLLQCYRHWWVSSSLPPLSSQ